ncbi:HDOD domain-containing protein [Desulfobacterales bacterium HSG17]|nr:HDOD domain-containing protein [Desulfobacterales bacterium HSG17]
MSTNKNGAPVYSFEKATYVIFPDRKDFRLAKYNDISLEGFSCFCNKPMDQGEKLQVEINLKMITGGIIDDLIPNIAEAKFTGKDTIDGKIVYQFKFIDFAENCFDNLTTAIDYLDKKEKLVSLPDMLRKNLDAQQTFLEVVKFVSEGIQSGQIDLPVLPTIVQEIEKIIRNPHSTSEDLAGVIETDAVISVKILSIANSPFYKGDSHILTIKEAIPRLGINEIQNLVLTISNKSIYNTKNRQFKNLLEKLWLHSLATACIAKSLATELEFSESSHFFTLGIVHDIGRTILLRVIGEMTSGKESFKTEDIIESTDKYTLDLTKTILGHWGFPHNLIDTVVLHKNIDKNTDKEILILHVADALAATIGFDLRGTPEHIRDIDAVKLIAISTDTLTQICENTKIKIKKSAAAFN